MAHARLSPSSAHRWARCPAAPSREAPYRDLAGYEAAEGTVFHEFVAEHLISGKPLESFVGKTLKLTWDEGGKEVEGEIAFDEEMVRHAQPGLQQIETWLEDDSLKMHVEQRVDLSDVLGEKAFGTADLIFVGPMRLIVADWKYGRGVPVAPMDNEQLLLYAIGAWNKYATKEMREAPERATVELHIFQPRCQGGGGGWSISGAELLRRAEELSAAAEKTRASNPEAVPGTKQCLFCRVAKHGDCPERDRLMLDTINAEWDELAEDLAWGNDGPKPLTDEMKVRIVLLKKDIIAWLEQIHAEVIDDLLKGRKLPGVKLAQGRKGPRHIPAAVADEAAEMAELLLGEEAFVRKLDSLSRLERKFGAGVVQEALGCYVKQSPPKPVIVPEDDTRHQPYRTVDDEWDEIERKSDNG